MSGVGESAMTFSAFNVLCVGLCSNKPLLVALEKPTSVSDLKQILSADQSEQLYLCDGGVPLSDEDMITHPSTGSVVLTAHYRLLGGKGGFGSLIRATGSHINRSSDKSACRDISGRRMRDIKKEKKIAEWVATEQQRKRERAERKKKRLQKMLEEPRHQFEDSSYVEQIRSTEEGMADSLKQGLRQAEVQDTAGPSKRPKLWMESDDLSSSDSEDESPPAELLYTNNDGPSTQCDEHSASSSKEHDSPSSSQQSASDDSPSSSNEPSHDNSSKEPPSDDSSNEPRLTSKQTDPDTQPASESSKPDSVQTSIDNQTTATNTEQTVCEPVDLSLYSSVEELVTVGGDRLKVSLQALGLKCGGTPLERAQRLFVTKGKALHELPRSLFAKNKNKK